VLAYLKDCTDPDPAMREMGLRTLQNFGPAARKVVDKDGKNLFAKTVLSRMNNDKEKDPGVRSAAFATAATMGFEDDADVKEAVRILGHTADVGVSGGMSRQNAVQALAAFGQKAEGAIAFLLAGPTVDLAYETRRSVAFTLGKIALNEKTGPNARALTCLSTVLANDPSAVVRLEAMQSLAILGPPWESTLAPGDKNPPKLDMVGVAAHVNALKKRLAPAPTKPGEKSTGGIVERDKQVELWLRFVLMRFDTKEINDEHLNAIAKALTTGDQGVKIQALTILGMMSDVGAKKLPDIANVLMSEDLALVQTAIGSLATLGVNAKPALPELRKLLTHKDEGIKKMAQEAIRYISDTKSPSDMPAKKP
jgi:HEAT repeat protein